MKRHIINSSNMIFFYLLLIFAGSCQKEKAPLQNLSVDKVEVVDSVLLVDHLGTKKSKHKSFKDIYRGLDKEKLNQFVAKVKGKYQNRTTSEFLDIPSDPVLEAEAAQILQPVNAGILSYLSQTYPQFGSTAMIDINDPDFTYFSTVYQIAEQANFVITDIPILTLERSSSSAAMRPIPTWLRCTVDVAIGYFDITAVISGLGTFEFGTVWSAVKFAAKKYLGWVAAAFLIYDITTQCLNL